MSLKYSSRFASTSTENLFRRHHHNKHQTHQNACDKQRGTSSTLRTLVPIEFVCARTTFFLASHTSKPIRLRRNLIAKLILKTRMLLLEKLLLTRKRIPIKVVSRMKMRVIHQRPQQIVTCLVRVSLPSTRTHHQTYPVIERQEIQMKWTPL